MWRDDDDDDGKSKYITGHFWKFELHQKAVADMEIPVDCRKLFHQFYTLFLLPLHISQYIRRIIITEGITKVLHKAYSDILGGGGIHALFIGKCQVYINCEC
jgi:hypothetical protein